MIEPGAAIIGWLSIVALLYLYRYCDELADGNIDRNQGDDP